MISVLMTAYNSERFIANAMLSVFNQTNDDWELIIVDDCSKDKTLDRIEYMIGIHRKKIKVIKNKENLGHTKSMNIALKAAQGDFLAWQDSDDISEPHRFEKQVIALTRYGLVTTHGIAINEDGSRIKNPYTDKWQRESKLSIMRKLGRDCCFLLPSLMWRREVVNKIGYFDELCYCAQDFNYLLRALKYFDITIIPEELFRFRKHENSVRKSFKAKARDWHQFAIARVKECPKVY